MLSDAGLDMTTQMPIQGHMERKSISLERSLLDLRRVDTGTEIEGYASVWDTPDAYGDVIRRGAFARTLRERERPVRMRWQHFGPIIGRWLELREDDIGLYVRGVLIKGHSVADDAAAAIAAGAVDGLSIGFFARSWRDLPDGGRELTDIDLVEISVVEEPAQTRATLREVRALAAASTIDDLIAGAVSCGVQADVARAIVMRARDLGAIEYSMARLFQRLEVSCE